MNPLSIHNPFPGAASFHVETSVSTMDDARKIARLGFPPGTVIIADAQSAGRGRFPDREWLSRPGESVLATLVLGPEAAGIEALPLRIGLALCRAIGILAVQMEKNPGPPALKWPNDVLMDGRKVAGILCESSPEATFIGFGINVSQRAFPEGLAAKATSLALAMDAGPPGLDRFRILELVLDQVSLVLREPGWHDEAESFLWRKGEEVSFLSGLPEKGEVIAGRLAGLDPSGALVIDTGQGSGPRTLVSGELSFPVTEEAGTARVDRNGSDHIR